ncbi:MAG: aromatic ring-hydroxylating dioxygenase subunit alpha [Bacteroidia bacterium]|nr:aromatic ring-hydroxylating dioxygenase subunit alpha [Bacteroidia bacterium]
MEEKLFVDADIRKAETLHADFYTKKEFFEISKEKIFSKTWQFIGDNDQLRVAGQMVPHTFLDGFVNEPMLLVRDKNDKINCLSNVCTHRGNILIENPCVDTQIRCRYHGRRFFTDGKFQHMPEFEGVENFPCEKDDLPKIPFGEWEKFLFASVSPKIKLEDALREMKNRLSWLPLNEFKFEPLRSRDYIVKAHWALYCENYLEGFHIPFVHNSLNAAIDYGSYKTELYPYSSLQLALSKGGDDVFHPPANSPDHGLAVAAYYYWVFPNMMFNFYPWGLSVNIVKPMGPELTKVSFLTYIYDETKLERGAGAALDKVEREDEAIVENVQKGIRSKFYSNGRYSAKRETGTHHFHRLICEFMNA